MQGASKKIGTMRIFGLDKMSQRRRRLVADWLIKQAKAITKDGSKYSGQFTARYFVYKADPC